METTSSTGHKSPGTTTESTAGGITVDRDYLAKALGIELPTDVQRLGVDGAGEVHYYSPRTARVWVVDANDDAVTHEADLAGKRVHEWLDHVREEVATLAELGERDIRALTEAMTVLDERAPAPADAAGLPNHDPDCEVVQ